MAAGTAACAVDRAVPRASSRRSRLGQAGAVDEHEGKVGLGGLERVAVEKEAFPAFGVDHGLFEDGAQPGQPCRIPLPGQRELA